jgi:Ras-related protein Rab-11A
MIDRIGVIYCEFDEIIGPVPKISYPKIKENLGMKIASKSIDLLSSDTIFDSTSLAFFPFPTEKKKGIIRCFEWKDENLRGGIGTGSLTLLFDEDDDVIFYKYNKDFEIIIEDATNKVIKLKTLKVDDRALDDELKKILEMFKYRLKELNEQELGGKEDSEAFPAQDVVDGDEKYSFKVVICGDPACGKTSTILKFTNSAFKRTYIPTVGVNVSKKEVVVDGKKIFLVLWDIAGQQKFSFIRGQFYQGAKAILILHDVTRVETFESVRGWYNDIIKFIGRDSTAIELLCGNKIDLNHIRTVSSQDAQKLAKELNILYLEISALTGENIEEIFYLIAKNLVESVNE